MGIKFKKPKSGEKVKKLYIASCIVVLFSSFLSVFYKSTSYADTENPVTELQLASYYSALGECIGSAMHGANGLGFDDEIKNGDISPSYWWDIDDGWTDLGVDSEKAQTYVNGKPTITKCTTVAEKALPLFGWSAGDGHSIYLNFLKDIGCKFNSSSVSWTCHVEDDSARVAAFRSAVKSKTGVDYGDPSQTYKKISDMAKFYWYTSDFAYGCQGTQIKSPSDSQTSYANNAASGGTDYSESDGVKTYYINIDYVDPSGGTNAAAVSTVYSYKPAVYRPPSPTKGGDTGATTTGTFSSATWLYGYIGHDSSMYAKNRIYNSDDNTANAYNAAACKDIAKHISNLSGVAVNYYKSNPTIDQNNICSIDPSAEGCQDETDSGATTSCSIDGIGWIVCPVLTFLGKISDMAYNFLADELLVTNPDYVQADSSNAVYNIWAIMRNIANVLFIIVFLIMVFSQLTGFGISNYGIKKLLPKLVMIAILVNVSFLVCQVAVDLSNILGYSIKQMFDGLGQYAQTPGVDDASGNGFGIAAIIAAVLVGGITVALTISVPVVLAVVLALLSLVLILVTRTTLIILLVIVSPLIMVSYLFPGTENLFKKAKKLSISLLMLFPLVSLLFGAGNLAAKAINTAAQESGSITMQLVSIGAAVLPLFMLPSLLRGSLNAVGSIGTKLSGWSTAASRRIGGKVKDTSTLGSYKAAFDRNQQIKRAQILGGVYKGRNPIARGSSYLRGRLNTAGITGSVGTRTAQLAAQTANRLDLENVENSRAQIRQANVNNDALLRIASGETSGNLNGRDASMRAAAMETLLQRGQYRSFQTAWNGMINEHGGRNSRYGNEVMRVVSSTLQSSNHRPGFMGMGTLSRVQQGLTGARNPDGTINQAELDRHQAESLAQNNANRYSPQRVSSTSREELDYMLSSYEAQHGPGAVPPELVAAATTALDNPEIEQNIGDNRDFLAYIRSIGTNNPLPRPQL